MVLARRGQVQPDHGAMIQRRVALGAHDKGLPARKADVKVCVAAHVSQIDTVAAS